MKSSALEIAGGTLAASKVEPVASLPYSEAAVMTAVSVGVSNAVVPSAWAASSASASPSALAGELCEVLADVARTLTHVE